VTVVREVLVCVGVVEASVTRIAAVLHNTEELFFFFRIGSSLFLLGNLS